MRLLGIRQLTRFAERRQHVVCLICKRGAPVPRYFGSVVSVTMDGIWPRFETLHPLPAVFVNLRHTASTLFLLSKSMVRLHHGLSEGAVVCYAD
jgi:hypothetical protein